MRSQLIGVFACVAPTLPAHRIDDGHNAGELTRGEISIKMGLRHPTRVWSSHCAPGNLSSQAWRASFNSGNRFWLETEKSHENMQIQKLGAKPTCELLRRHGHKSHAAAATGEWSAEEARQRSGHRFVSRFAPKERDRNETVSP